MLAEKIKRYRRAEGLTQKELAVVLDMSQNTISQYETGKRMPAVKKLLELSALFGCSIEELTNACSDADGAGSAADK